MKEKLKILTYILTFLVKIIERCIKFILRLNLITNSQIDYNIRIIEKLQLLFLEAGAFFSVLNYFSNISLNAGLWSLL